MLKARIISSSLLKSCLNPFSSMKPKVKKSKRVISLAPQKISIEDADDSISQEEKRMLQNKAKIQQLKQAMSSIPADWQYMNFQNLCNLSPSVKDAIELQIKKTSFTQDQEMFDLATNINPYEDLNPYWLNIYKLFNHQTEVDPQFLRKRKENGYLAEMYFFSLNEEESNLRSIIRQFLQNIHKPRKLETIAEPTFCKYLLSLKRDLSLKGVRIRTEESDHIPISQIKFLKVLNYEYQFWVDVKHNRGKNGKEEDFIVEKRVIDNPNNSILMQNYPKVNMKYIVRKKRRQQIQKCFCTKVDILIEVDGFKHVVKVQWKGPSDKKIQNVPKDEEGKIKYWIIDYDNIYKGNPTIRPVFQF